MSPTKWLNHFLFLECVLGIYRNYCRQKKTKKFFIILQIFVQMTLHGFILINEETFLLGGKGIDANKLAHGAFSAVSFCNSFSAVTISLCYSNVFMCFVRSFSRVFEYFQENSFIHDLKKIYWFSVISTIICIPFSFYRSLEILINEIQMEGDTDMFILISVFTSQALIRFMIVFEKILFFFVIMIVVQLVKCLKSAISTVQARIGRCEISFNEQRVLTREQIQGWVELYRDLANCCEKLTLCFGRQFIFSCLMSTTYYMLLTNHMCNKNVSNRRDKRTFLIAASFISITMLPIIAGQLARNQGRKFHRVLARLYNTVIIIDSNEAEAKLIKDFIRLIKKKPIEIKLLSNVPAGMYMLPVALMLAVNYVIVIMQFNNVI